MQILNYNYANKHKNAIDALSLEIGAQQSSSLQHAHHATAIAVQPFCGEKRENEYSTIVLVKLRLLWSLFFLSGLFFEMQIFKKRRNQEMTVNLFLQGRRNF